MRFLAITGALAIAAAFGGLIYFLGGNYSVAAARPNFGIVSWAIGAIRDSSVSKHANAILVRAPDDMATVRAGARAFAQDGCANCHGGPGIGPAKFAEAMRPRPPDLKTAGEKHDAARLFWIIKNGVTLTGMPAYGALRKDEQELWSLVAFVRNLRWISAADYATWTAPDTPAAEKPPGKPAAKPRATIGKK